MWQRLRISGAVGNSGHSSPPLFTLHLPALLGSRRELTRSTYRVQLWQVFFRQPRYRWVSRMRGEPCQNAWVLCCGWLRRCSVAIATMGPPWMCTALGSCCELVPRIRARPDTFGLACFERLTLEGLYRWEIATRATPWDELGTALEYLELCSRLADALQTGRRPNLPQAVSTEHPAFTSVMQRCWSGDPVNRPTFSQVVVLLQDCGPASLHTAQGRTRGDAESGLSQRLLAEPW